MSSVALLSNYKTRNLGNLALTQVVQRLLTEAYGADHLLGLHRLPHPVAEQAARGEPSQWTGRLEHQIGRLSDLTAPPPEAYGERRPGLASVPKETADPNAARRAAVALAHTAVGTRVRARLDRSTARTHVGAMLAADTVVWNPGGELNLSSTPTSRLVDLAVAMDQGRRTAMVNFSFEATDEAMAYFRVQARRLDRVIGRDQRTTEAMVDLGVDTSHVRLAPDAVFLLGSEVIPELGPAADQVRREVVGIVLHGLTDIDAPAWARVVQGVRRTGRAVEVISSHRATDGRAIDHLVAATGPGQVTVLPEFSEIGPYLRHLGGLDAIVTGRFHSAVMGLLAGITVVGVDTYGSKVAGGLTTAGLASAAVSGTDWPEQAVAIIEAGPVLAPSALHDIRARVLDAWRLTFPL